VKQRFKPYRKRKPFKRKTGGPKYMLGRGAAHFPKLPEIPDFKKLISSLFAIR